MKNNAAQEERLKSLPIAETGETVYSLLCRYAARTKFQDKIVLETLTGQRLVNALLAAIPGYIPTISTVVPDKHPWADARFALLNNTAFPYYSFFDSPEQKETAINNIVNNNLERSVAMSLGLMAYPREAIPKHPRFCMSCVEEDLINSGFTYYHREHQLPGTSVCWRHGDILSHGCTVCGPYPIINQALCMPGRCGCSKSISPLATKMNLPNNDEALHWLAQQSALIVSSQGTACKNIRQALRSFAMERGIAKGSLLDYHKLANAINDRYGEEFLNWLGSPAIVDGQPSPWVRRLLYPQLHEQKRSPVILFLLIIGVFFESISEFEESVTSLENPNLQNEDSSPKECIETLKAKPRLEECQIEKIIEFSKKPPCGIPGLADRLGVKIADVVATIKLLQIRFPLTKSTTNRLGAEVVAAIRKDLLRGLDKIQIQKKHYCSEWSLDLIVMDDPTLNEKHKEASKIRRRDMHRRALKRFIKKNPALTRSKLQEIATGTYEYLLEYDQEWFHKTLPAQPRTSTGERTERYDWEERDKIKAEEIQRHLDSIDTDEKPVWVTETELLKRVSILPSFYNNKDKYPLVKKIIQEKSESRTNFIERKLEWAITKMRDADVPLSINKLRRVAGFPAKVVRQHRPFILKTAIEAKAKIDMKSFFISQG